MPQFLSPDVVTEEVQGKSGQIPTESTSTFALVGYSPRGPEGKAYVNTSLAEFMSRFGGFTKKSYNCYAAAAFYLNGGSQLVFVRELHSDATLAQGTLGGKWLIKASGRGSWANDAEVTISGNDNFMNPETGVYSAFDVTIELVNSDSGLLEVSETFEAVNLTDPEDPSYIIKVIEANSEDITVQAVSGGGVPTALSPVSASNVTVATAVAATATYTHGLADEILPGSLKLSIDGVEIGADDGSGVISGATVSGTIDYETGDLSITFSAIPAVGKLVKAAFIKAADKQMTVVLSGGADGSAVVASDVLAASLKAQKRGIYALDDVDSQLAIALPDYAGDATSDLLLIGYCESRQDAVAIIQPPKGTSPQNAVKYRRNTLKSVSSYGAMYYPWVSVPDPLNKNRPYIIPPCGHVAGRFAYTDATENVGKAPAGNRRGQLSGFFSGLERTLSKAERDIVYQAQINPIRSDANVGTAIYGNKTLQIVGDFTEVNVRRLFIFLRNVQYVGLLDLLFEDIGPVTFSLIRTRLELFLEGLYLNNVIGSGVLDKAQAFKVICDETNNPEAIQVAKRIVVDEFIKPNLAAEFIHLRLQRVFDATQV